MHACKFKFRIIPFFFLFFVLEKSASQNTLTKAIVQMIISYFQQFWRTQEKLTELYIPTKNTFLMQSKPLISPLPSPHLNSSIVPMLSLITPKLRIFLSLHNQNFSLPIPSSSSAFYIVHTEHKFSKVFLALAPSAHRFWFMKGNTNVSHSNRINLSNTDSFYQNTQF